MIATCSINICFNNKIIFNYMHQKVILLQFIIEIVYYNCIYKSIKVICNMSKKNTPPLKISKLVKHKAVVQPILEQDPSPPASIQNSTPNNTQVSEILEDINDMIENVANMSLDIVETFTNSMNLTTNLVSNIVTGASACMGEITNQNSTTYDKLTKCSNATDILSFNRSMLDNNFGLFNQLSVNLGNHINDFTSGISEVISYNLKNNWLEKFKNKKKYS